MLIDQPCTSVDHARALICELARRFYDLGWVSGTGGGISIRVGDDVVMAPSGVQKELLQPDDMFLLDVDGRVKHSPSVVDGSPPKKVSACAPLFLAAMQRRGAGAVVHSHSLHAMCATLLAGRPSDDRCDMDVVEFTHLEMMKGLAGVGYHDVHHVPVVENTAHEAELEDRLRQAIDAFPDAHAVLVRRHGVYVWGDDWQSAKRHAECYDFLFQAYVRMRELNVPMQPNTN